jgi:hypothetical protein
VRNGFSGYGKYQTIPRDDGDDPVPIPRKYGDGIEYVNYLGKLFIKGTNDSHEIFYDDARQLSVIGDCYLMAAMSAVAMHRPEDIRSLFQDNDDGTYLIHFRLGSISRAIGGKLNWENPVEPVFLDTDLPRFKNSLDGDVYFGYSTDTNASGQPELWSSLLEKAYAIAYGGRSYAGIVNQNSGMALKRLTGSHVTEYAINGVIPGVGAWSEADLFNTIRDAIVNRRPTTISTRSGAPDPWIDAHVYVPIAVNSASQSITLYNPREGTISSYTIANIKQNCDYLWIAD